MSSEMALTALSSLLSLLIICCLVFWGYRTYRVDLFRQKMFWLRDEFYDYADAGNIDFTHPAYGVLRSTMNGYIRFGHRLTLWHFIFSNLLITDEDYERLGSFEQSWERATTELDEKMKNELEEYRMRMDILAVKHALLAAPEFFTIFPIAIVILVIVIIFKLGSALFTHRQKVKETIFLLLRPMFRGIDDAAFGEGQLAT